MQSFWAYWRQPPCFAWLCLSQRPTNIPRSAVAAGTTPDCPTATAFIILTGFWGTPALPLSLILTWRRFRLCPGLLRSQDTMTVSASSSLCLAGQTRDGWSCWTGIRCLRGAVLSVSDRFCRPSRPFIGIARRVGGAMIRCEGEIVCSLSVLTRTASTNIAVLNSQRMLWHQCRPLILLV